MSRDPTRAALALLCVVVVLFGGSLFPTAGFGSYPAGLGGGNGAAAPGGSPGAGVDDPAAPTPQTGPTETAQTTRTTDDDGPAESATPTPTETETETPAAGGPSSGGDSLTDALVGLLLLLGTPLLILLGVAFAPGIDERTTVAGLPVGRFRTNLRAFFAAVPRRTTSFVVGLSASLPGVLDRAAAAAAGAAEALGVVAGGLLRGSGRTLAALGGGLAAVATGVTRAFGGGLSALFGGLQRAGSGRFSRDRTPGSADGDAPAGPTDDDPEEPPTPRSVEEAWALMAERVPVGNRRAATPGEYARAAVAAGFPEDAVRRLTGAFERVRYGGASGGTHLPDAREALARIRAFLDGGDEA